MVKLRRQPNSAEKNKLQRVNSTPIDTKKVEQEAIRKMVEIKKNKILRVESPPGRVPQKYFNHISISDRKSELLSLRCW